MFDEENQRALRSQVDLLTGEPRLTCERILADITDGREKHKLECRKIEAEVRQATLPLWKKAEFYAAVMPVALAVAGIAFSWSSGWFDAQQKHLDAQKTLLEYEVKRLEEQKESRITEVAALQLQIVRLQGDIDVAKSAVTNLNRAFIEVEEMIQEFQTEWNARDFTAKREKIIEELQNLPGSGDGKIVADIAIQHVRTFADEELALGNNMARILSNLGFTVRNFRTNASILFSSNTASPMIEVRSKRGN
jgi:hypothetical protein